MTNSDEAAVIEPIDFEGLTKDVPRGKWVAISSDHARVVAHGDSVDEVISGAERAGENDPLIARVPEENTVLVL